MTFSTSDSRLKRSPSPIVWTTTRNPDASRLASTGLPYSGHTVELLTTSTDERRRPIARTTRRPMSASSPSPIETT